MRFCVLITHHQSSCAHSVESASTSFVMAFGILCATNWQQEAVCIALCISFALSSSPRCATPHSLLICCIHLLRFRPNTAQNISHANLFSAIAFASMHAVHFIYPFFFHSLLFHSDEKPFLSKDVFFLHTIFTFIIMDCVCVRAYRKRNALRRYCIVLNYGYIPCWCRCISFLVCLFGNWRLKLTFGT